MNSEIYKYAGDTFHERLLFLMAGLKQNIYFNV